MADNKDTESFALGLIVAAIIFLLLRREFSKRAISAVSSSAEETTATPRAGAGAGKSGCSCGGGTGSKGGANPPAVIPIGGQSYNTAQPYTPPLGHQLVYEVIA